MTVTVMLLMITPELMLVVSPPLARALVLAFGAVLPELAYPPGSTTQRRLNQLEHAPHQHNRDALILYHYNSRKEQ